MTAHGCHVSSCGLTIITPPCTWQAKTEKDLEDAIEFAKNEATDSLCLIECIVHRCDSWEWVHRPCSG